MGKTYGWGPAELNELTIEEINYLIQKIEKESKDLNDRYNRRNS